MFSWDVNKAFENFIKHGVSFEEAATVFSDAMALDWEDLLHSEVEKRSKRLGMSMSGRVILVVYTLRRTEHVKETIRIISARRASHKEREAYARWAN